MSSYVKNNGSIRVIKGVFNAFEADRQERIVKGQRYTNPQAAANIHNGPVMHTRTIIKSRLCTYQETLMRHMQKHMHETCENRSPESIVTTPAGGGSRSVLSQS